MSENTPIRFSLKSIQTNEFATSKKDDIVLQDVTLENQIGFGLSYDTHEIVASTKTTFHYKDRPFIILKVTCAFEIEPEDIAKITTLTDTHVIVENGIMVHFADVALGTARGILHSKLEGTEFKEYILPMVSFKNILLENISFERAIEHQQ